jgi:hypothetical protein
VKIKELRNGMKHVNIEAKVVDKTLLGKLSQGSETQPIGWQQP